MNGKTGGKNGGKTGGKTGGNEIKYLYLLEFLSKEFKDITKISKISNMNYLTCRKVLTYFHNIGICECMVSRNKKLY